MNDKFADCYLVEGVAICPDGREIITHTLTVHYSELEAVEWANKFVAPDSSRVVKHRALVYKCIGQWDE